MVGRDGPKDDEFGGGPGKQGPSGSGKGKERATEDPAPTPDMYATQEPRSAKTKRQVPKVHSVTELPKDYTDIDESFAAFTKIKVTDTTHWNKSGACGEKISSDYSIWEMIADINGSEGFSSDKAATGTVSSSLFLQVTSGMTVPDNFEIGKDPFVSPEAPLNSEEYQKRVLLFLWANARALIDSDARISQEVAVFLAHIRLHFVIAGGTAQGLHNRAIYVDEYTNSSATFAQVTLVDILITKLVANFIADHWMIFVAMCRHMFVTRGHHWKDTYDNHLTKMWESCNVEVPTGVRLPPWQHLIRSSIHCFGIRSLQLLTMEAYDQARLPGAMVKRIFAASAGTAPWRTAWAGIELMKQTIWYEQFAYHFQAHIDELSAINTFLIGAGVRCHVNAKLFNFEWEPIHISDTPVKVLAPYILGFADTLDDRDPFRGQRTLDKYANASSSVRAAFNQLLSNVRKIAKNMETITEYFSVAPATRMIE
jgi:hypothetical protein